MRATGNSVPATPTDPPPAPLLTPVARARARGVVRVRRILITVLAGLLVGVGAFAIGNFVLTPRRSTPVYDPPVLAGQQLWGYCAGGFYARKGETIVLTSTGHCAAEGTVAYDPDGTTVRGVFGPAARDATCPYAGHKCASSDINYLVVAPDRIPWGHLNVVDLGTAGYRIIEPGTQPLACADVAVDDLVEIDGRNIYRSGTVVEKGEYLHAEDGDYFPCMIAARIQVATGDSGGAVLVRGIPAGVTSRSFGGYLGFTPLAEGLEQLGLELCTTPDCDLAPPRAGTSRPSIEPVDQHLQCPCASRERATYIDRAIRGVESRVASVLAVIASQATRNEATGEWRDVSQLRLHASP